MSGECCVYLTAVILDEHCVCLTAVTVDEWECCVYLTAVTVDEWEVLCLFGNCHTWWVESVCYLTAVTVDEWECCVYLTAVTVDEWEVLCLFGNCHTWWVESVCYLTAVTVDEWECCVCLTAVTVDEWGVLCLTAVTVDEWGVLCLTAVTVDEWGVLCLTAVTVDEWGVLCLFDSCHSWWVGSVVFVWQLSQLMSGEYADQVEDFHVIDCRYPYEFEGGHIEVSLELDCTPLRINGLACGHGLGVRSHVEVHRTPTLFMLSVDWCVYMGWGSCRGSQNPHPFHVSNKFGQKLKQTCSNLSGDNQL